MITEQWVSRKKTTIFSATFSIWGLMGQDVKMCCRKCHIWNHRNADLDLPIYYTTFTGLRWWLRVVYSWVPPLLSVFGRKIQSCFRPKFDGFGDKLGFKIKFNFITQKGTSLRDFTSFELSRVRIHPRVWPVGEPENKGTNKKITNIFRYISPVCPDAHIEWIFTKFDVEVPLADVINCAEFFCRSVQGYWFCGGWNLPIPIGVEGRRCDVDIT